MELLPRPGLLPVPQPTPAGHPGPATHLLGQVLPRAAADQHEDDPGQRRAIRHARPSRLLPCASRQVRLDQLPQRIVQQRLRHRRTSVSDGRSYATPATVSCVLLEALRRANATEITTFRSVPVGPSDLKQITRAQAPSPPARCISRGRTSLRIGGVRAAAPQRHDGDRAEIVTSRPPRRTRSIASGRPCRCTTARHP